MKIVVLAELLDGRPTRFTGDLLGCARQLANEGRGEVIAVLLDDSNVPQELIACGADEVVQVENAHHDEVSAEESIAAIERVSKEREATLVLIAHSASGADIAPRLAFRMQCGAAMGCADIRYSDAKLLFTRPRQGGIAHEVLSFKTPYVVATLRAGYQAAAVRDARRSGRVTRIAVGVSAPRNRVRVIEHRREAESGERLEDAKIIVAGGRGLNGPEGFGVLQTLAQALGGAVGASRVPCDLGWCPRSWQIGLTGKTVTPDLYIAVGISGAGHHMAGCGNAKTIVAVNTDPGAAIFKEARYGIVGDYQKVVPALVEAIQSMHAA